MRCEGCGCVFCPDWLDDPGDQPARYCSKLCKKAAKKRRNRASQLSTGPLGVACVAKKPFASPEDALRAMVRRGWTQGGGAYKCGDHYHVTHRPGGSAPWKIREFVGHDDGLETPLAIGQFS